MKLSWVRVVLAFAMLGAAALPLHAAREDRAGRAGRGGAADKPAPAPAPAKVLPDNLKALVAQQLPNGKVLDFEEQTEETRHLFFIDVQDGDKKKTLLCSGRAQYLGILDPADNPDDDDDATYLDYATAPQAVRDGIKKLVPTATIEALSFEVDKERFFYIAEYTAGGKAHFATFTLDGQLTEEETDLDLQDLPAPVKAAVTKAHPAAKLDSASTIVAKNVTTYAVDFVEGGKDFEAIVTPAGAISSTDALDDGEPAKPAK